MSDFNNIQEDQLHNIDFPHANDVLSGRGNYVNFHPGNEYFRTVVKDYEQDYATASKRDKKQFAVMIVDQIKLRNPPGRFLKLSEVNGKYYDIGCKKALEKTRQALRENVPELFKKSIGSEGSSDVKKSIGKLQNPSWSANILSSENTKDTVTPPSVRSEGSTSSSNSANTIHIANTTRTNVACTGDTIKLGSDNGNNTNSFHSTANTISLEVQNRNTFQKSGYANTPLNLSLISEDNMIHNNNPTSDKRIVGADIINPGGSFRTEVQHEVSDSSFTRSDSDFTRRDSAFTISKDPLSNSASTIHIANTTQEFDRCTGDPITFGSDNGNNGFSKSFDSIANASSIGIQNRNTFQKSGYANIPLNLSLISEDNMIQNNNPANDKRIVGADIINPGGSLRTEVQHEDTYQNMHNNLQPLPFLKGKESEVPKIESIELKRTRELERLIKEAELELRELKDVNTKPHLTETHINHTASTEQRGKIDSIYASNERHPRNSEEVEELLSLSMPKRRNSFTINDIFSDSPSESSMDVSFLKLDSSNKCMASIQSNQEGIIESTEKDDDYKQPNGKSKRPSFLYKDSDNMIKFMTSVGELSILSKESNEYGGETPTDDDYKQSNGKNKRPSFFNVCKESDNMMKLMSSVGEMSILSNEFNEDGEEQDAIHSLCFPSDSSESLSKKSSRVNHGFEHINGDPDFAKMFTSIGEISTFSTMTDETRRSKETQTSSDMSFQIETLDENISTS